MPLNFDIRRLLRTPGFTPEEDSATDMMGELNAARRPPALPELSDPGSAPMTPAGDPGSMPGPSYGSRPQSRYEQRSEAENVYLQGTPGRKRSALTGALQGFGQGGLGGAIAGAITGAVSPRTVRRQQFRQEIQPQIEERFAYEDQDAQAAQQGAFNQARMTGLGLENREREARIRKLNEPAPDTFEDASGIGIYNKRTGQVTTPPAQKPPAQRPITFQGRTYDYADPVQRKALEDAQAQAPRDRYGRFISRADERASRPRAAAKPKAAAKYASMDDVREAAEKAGMTPNQMATKFRERGYRIITTR